MGVGCRARAHLRRHKSLLQDGQVEKGWGRETKLRLGRRGWVGHRLGSVSDGFKEDKLGEMDTNQNTGSVRKAFGGWLGLLRSL